jgi:hypothetical protein
MPLRSHVLDVLLKRIHFLTAPLIPRLLIVGAQFFQRFLHGEFRRFSDGYSSMHWGVDGRPLQELQGRAALFDLGQHPEMTVLNHASHIPHR